MAKFLGIIMGLWVLVVSQPIRADVSQVTLERVTDFVCGQEMSISAPESYLWEIRCNYRFAFQGAEVWVAYMATRSFGSPEELADEAFCREHPGIWCQEPRPPRVIRYLTVAVRWVVLDDHDPGNFIEDYVIDEGLSGRPNFGSVQSREVTPQAFRLYLDRREGLQYQPYWSMRYHELIDAVRAQMPGGDQS